MSILIAVLIKGGSGAVWLALCVCVCVCVCVWSLESWPFIYLMRVSLARRVCVSVWSLESGPFIYLIGVSKKS